MQEKSTFYAFLLATFFSLSFLWNEMFWGIARTVTAQSYFTEYSSKHDYTLSNMQYIISGFKYFLLRREVCLSK